MANIDTLLEILQSKNIHDPQVLNALKHVPRDLFVSKTLQTRAFDDVALPIEHEQTISQPFVVARMTELVMMLAPQKVLEIGTGSGYQAAVLAQLVPEVYTIERIKALHMSAQTRLNALKLTNVHFHHGDGNAGWLEFAPYDAILSTAASETIPAAWRAQLRPGGIIVAPIGHQDLQYLQVTRIEADQKYTKIYDPVSFVPLLPGIL